MLNSNTALIVDPEIKQPEIFVVDGSNVCFWYGQAFKNPLLDQPKGSVRPLLVLLSEIREHGDDFYCIFDASIMTNIYKYAVSVTFFL